MFIKRDYLQYVNEIKKAETEMVSNLENVLKQVQDPEILNILENVLEQEKHHLNIAHILLEEVENLD